MNYDHWRATPDGERWTRQPEREPGPPEEPSCFDCHGSAAIGSTSVPVEGGRRFCGHCARWRGARGWLFDPRVRRVLDTEVA